MQVNKKGTVTQIMGGGGEGEGEKDSLLKWRELANIRVMPHSVSHG